MFHHLDKIIIILILAVPSGPLILLAHYFEWCRKVPLKILLCAGSRCKIITFLNLYHAVSNDLLLSLYYRFRSEYRLERKLLAELDVDPSSHQEELSGLFATNDQGRHNISRVVVLHNDKIETFCNPEQAESSPDDFFDNDSFWSGSITWY